ncbi:unnamed protein product, partial [Iphiclides podalirius]
MTSKAMPDRVSHTGQAWSEGPDEEQHTEGSSIASDTTVGGDFVNSSFRNQRLTSTTLLVAPVGDVVVGYMCERHPFSISIWGCKLMEGRAEMELQAEKEADNKRLRDEVATLQKEVASMRLSVEKAARPAQERTPAPTLQAEHIARDVLSQIGTMISARFEALEERLLPEKRLRPPLAAERRGMSASIVAKPKKSVAKPVATPKPPAAAVKSITVPRPPLVATGSSALPKSGTASRPTVATATPAAANKKKRKRRGRKLRAPTTAAVVITLQHDAVEKGVTPENKAGGHGSSSSRASSTSEAADSFAAKLREVLAGEARIARPVKCADLRLTGLDDSVTRDEVRFSLQPPVPLTTSRRAKFGRAAGALAASGCNVQWQLLRSWKIGHTRLQCTSEVDRSDACYRCSAPGHKAATCSAKPHCAVCAVADKPAEHSVGGKGCSPPKKGKKAGRTPASQQVDRDSSRQEEMCVDPNNG